jgi:hypothetical protein
MTSIIVNKMINFFISIFTQLFVNLDKSDYFE